ncbi:MAG: glycoside hydrolase [Candidatus Eremiobacteraeota bacterium]|nr:glycoside hydrolase [Candidatus Eremiobacteraeota bacterium]
MHQPSYRTVDGEYRQPWVYLHAIKDYADMAWHLENVEMARATVSFAPVLLDQLDDYAAQFASGIFRDGLLRALQRGGVDGESERRQLCYALCRANYERMVRRFPAYERLFHEAETAAWGGTPLSDKDLADTLVWYHLVWFGEATRRNDERIKSLIEKAGGFSEGDRQTVLAVAGELVAGVTARYRALAASGRVELSASPYSHPILPLLIDFASAREARPEMRLPASPRYPGGRERAGAQLLSARAAHAARFGAEPRGCWPSEGAISHESMTALAAAGFSWAASGQAVLANSVRASAGDAGARSVHAPYVVHTDAGPIACLFRDDDLSDRIGFIYAPLSADDALRDLCSALGAIADGASQTGASVVTIILDGENAWEHYPCNAFDFMQDLYTRLGSHERLRLTTVSAHLKRAQAPQTLERVVAGSWVYGTLETWIGDEDKNRGWDLLCAAKLAFDESMRGATLSEAQRARAEHALRQCESSDWFWWFGGYNPPAPVRDFERLFRAHLHDLYAALGVPPPATLDLPVSIGTGADVYDGAMRRATKAPHA